MSLPKKERKKLQIQYDIESTENLYGHDTPKEIKWLNRFHIRNDGTGNAGIGRKNSHFSVIPLCYNHHLGPFSIHNKKLLFEQRHGTEKEILQIITKRLYGTSKQEI